MTAPYSNDDIKDWAESLRDQVSRISGRKKGGSSGFNAELKGDLLDAIDMLVEQASEDDTPDPIELALKQIELQVNKSLQDQEKAFRSSSEDILTSVAEKIVQESLQHTLEDVLKRGEHTAEQASEALKSLEDRWSVQAEHVESLCNDLQNRDEVSTQLGETISARADETHEQLQALREQMQSLVELQDSKRGNTEELDGYFAEVAKLSRESQEMERGLREELFNAKHSKLEGDARQRELEARVMELESLCERLEENCRELQEANRELQAATVEKTAQAEMLTQKRKESDRARKEAERARKESESKCETLQAKFETAESQNASIEAKFLETEQENVELLARNQRLESENKELLEQQGDQTQEQVLEVRNESLEAQKQELESRNSELEAANLDLENRAQELERQGAGSEADWEQKTQEKWNAEKEKLEQSKEELQHRLKGLEDEFFAVQSECEALRDQDGSDADAAAELNSDNERLRAELSEVNLLLEEALKEGENHELAGRMDELTELLTAAREEVEILRDQNSDLAAQLAKQQVLHSSSEAQLECDAGNLSWEDRKRLIMQQLGEEGEQEPERRVEIEQILAATELALTQKNLEIEDLQSKLEDSGNAIEAGTFDQDEAIQEELARLRKIQSEWEEKLRQAEIDLSTERAKLARERTEIEAELTGIRKEKNNEGARTRKWLDHLGLRDEAKNG